MKRQPVPAPYDRPSGVVYGPVTSRRNGRSLGINVLPLETRTCSFDCLYCQLPRPARPQDWRLEVPRLTPASSVVEQVDTALRGFSRNGIDTVSVVGNGDACLHPDLSQIARGVIELRDRFLAGTPVILFTNGFEPQDQNFYDALELFDRVYLKLDGGDRCTLRKVNRPIGAFDLEQHLAPYAGRRGLILQTMVVTGAVDNRKSVAGPGYADLVTGLRPMEVHLYTVERRPAFDCVKPVDPEELEALRAAVQCEVSMRVRAFCTLSNAHD